MRSSSPRLDQADAEIRDLLAREVLQPSMVETALDQAIATVRATETASAGPVRPLDATPRRRDDACEPDGIRRAARRRPAVLDAFNRPNSERRALLVELDARKAAPREDVCPDVRTLRRTLRGYFDEWQTTIHGNIPEGTRPAQRRLRERIAFTPVTGEGGAPFYELRIPIAFEWSASHSCRDWKQSSCG